MARIQRRFRVVTETYSVGPLRLPFTRVQDPDAVLDQVVIEEDRREKQCGERREGNELHLPYWAELWDSSFGIGQLLTEPKFSPAGLKVLDLGCGMGFTGMVAAAMGASVLCADLETDCLLFAKLNTLRWAGRVRRMNWQKDFLNERFDLIIGSDVLYDKTQWVFLEPFFHQHLARGGSVLLGEPGRQTGELFIEWIADKQWNLEQLGQKVATREKPIRIFQMHSV